jgi:CheY-like chemotaxis protein
LEGDQVIHVAVIEDNPDNMLLIQAMLKTHFRVVGYANGPDALRALPDEVPDVVLMDISLPEMDGPEVLRHMREDSRLKDIPVAAVTAHAMTGDRENLLAQGFDGYVSKPILDIDVLLDTVRTLAGETE